MVGPQAKSIAVRGIMLVLSSPSGAGKTTISRRLLERDPNMVMSVSATTRPRRPGERDGVDYQFVTPETFGLMVNRGEFLEHAKVFDHWYGTPKAPVMAALATGRDVLFDIDWQGTQALGESAKGDLVTVFILPPSTAELERRLLKRAQDSRETVTARMARAADEMSHWNEYDYVIVNQDLDESVGDIEAIVRAERRRRSRLVGLGQFVKQLQAGY